MRLEDVGAVMAIAAVVATAPHWPEFEVRRLLQVAEQQPARRGAWVAQGLDGPLYGFAVASQVAGTAELEAVVTAPAHWRKGVGLELTRGVIAWSRGAGAERLILEARMSNAAALGMYARFGFIQDGVRRGYYRNPEEDAMLLSLSLREKPETPPPNGMR